MSQVPPPSNENKAPITAGQKQQALKNTIGNTGNSASQKVSNQTSMKEDEKFALRAQAVKQLGRSKVQIVALIIGAFFLLIIGIALVCVFVKPVNKFCKDLYDTEDGMLQSCDKGVKCSSSL